MSAATTSVSDVGEVGKGKSGVRTMIERRREERKSDASSCVTCDRINTKTDKSWARQFKSVVGYTFKFFYSHFYILQ